LAGIFTGSTRAKAH